MVYRIFQMQTTQVLTDGGVCNNGFNAPACAGGGPSIIVGGGGNPMFGGVTGFQNSMLNGCAPWNNGVGMGNNGFWPGNNFGFNGFNGFNNFANGFGNNWFGNNMGNGCNNGVMALRMMLTMLTTLLDAMMRMGRGGVGGDCGCDSGYDDYASRGRDFDYDYGPRGRGRFGDDYDYGPRGPRGPRGRDYDDYDRPIEPFDPSSSFDGKAPQIMERLMRDFDLTPEQAAGIVGNLGAETGGFRHHQEINPLGGGRGGLGWAQWTGPRRRAFEDYCAQRGLDPRSDEANYGFLAHELRTTERGALDAVRRARTTEEAMYAFERSYERAGIPNYGARSRYARRALQAFQSTGGGTVYA